MLLVTSHHQMKNSYEQKGKLSHGQVWFKISTCIDDDELC